MPSTKNPLPNFGGEARGESERGVNYPHWQVPSTDKLQVWQWCDSGVNCFLFLILRKLCMSLQLSGTVFLIQNLACAFFHILIQWSIWAHFDYHPCDFSKTYTHDRIHVCVSSFITFLFFGGTQSICLHLPWCLLLSTTFSETDINQRDKNDVGWCHDLQNCLTSKTCEHVLALAHVFDHTNWVLGAGKRQHNQSADGQTLQWCTTGISALFIPQLFTLYTPVSLCHLVTLCQAKVWCFFLIAHPAQPISLKSRPTVLYIDRSIDVPGHTWIGHFQ